MESTHVLMLHGALGSAREFFSLLEVEGHLTIMDFIGHGYMEKKPFSIESLTEQVIRMIETDIRGDLAVVGYSMGGYVALNVARTKPDAFTKIITLGTKFNWSKEVAEKEVGFLDADLLRKKQPEYASYLEDIHDDTWPDLIENTRNMMLGLGSNPILTEAELASIRVPVTICRGSKDQMVTEQESKWAAEHLPNGEYRELENVPHALNKVDDDVIYSLYREAAE